MTIAATVAGTALSLLGTGVASAGTGPKPSGPSAAAGSVGTEVGNPSSSAAQAAGVCSDAYQIGTTSYINRNTETIASVKQFYSPGCDENYGYLWVWKSFLDKNINFDLTVGVWSYDRDSLVGTRTVFDTHGQEFWGNAANTVGECTSGYGLIAITDEPSNEVRTEKRC
ncbi:hypothetical protein AQJ84_26810 [Streptomyces resistomycificus]|uniref:Secreted protein n=2 Tax=Streptomyces resistomycificus TaxID=67356 RepID=A0A0L8KZE7_9ACTN|nr:hypothetical protein ADK37_30710 [Streptomyces resistomycificus]KUN94300.1 hypothetical protein AQJ84_26810 [Streptomyces resistomycificus]